jgi:hypothetical protein
MPKHCRDDGRERSGRRSADNQLHTHCGNQWSESLDRSSIDQGLRPGRMLAPRPIPIIQAAAGCHFSFRPPGLATRQCLTCVPLPSLASGLAPLWRKLTLWRRRHLATGAPCKYANLHANGQLTWTGDDGIHSLRKGDGSPEGSGSRGCKSYSICAWSPVTAGN